MEFGKPRVDKIEEVEDRNPDLYLKRAEKHLRNNNAYKALIECDKAITYSNKGAHYLFEKMRILFNSKQYKKCIDFGDEHYNKLERDLDKKKLNKLNVYFYDAAEGLFEDFKRLFDTGKYEQCIRFGEKHYNRMTNHFRFRNDRILDKYLNHAKIYKEKGPISGWYSIYGGYILASIILLIVVLSNIIF